MRMEILLVVLVMTASVLSGCILLDDECDDESDPYDENHARPLTAHDPYNDPYAQDDCRQEDYDPEPYVRD